MKKIRLDVSSPAIRENGIIRIDPMLHHSIAQLAKATRMTMGGVANILLTEALAAVELVPTPLYDLKIAGGDEDADKT